MYNPIMDHQEMRRDLPLLVLGETILDSISALKRDTSEPDNSPKNTGREALRGDFRSMVYFCLDKGEKDMVPLITPEAVIAVAAFIPELELDDQTMNQLLEQYPIQNERGIDWDKEAVKILLDRQHPIRKISIQAKDHLSEAAKRELAKAEY